LEFQKYRLRLLVAGNIISPNARHRSSVSGTLGGISAMRRDVGVLRLKRSVKTTLVASGVTGGPKRLHGAGVRRKDVGTIIIRQTVKMLTVLGTTIRSQGEDGVKSLSVGNIRITPLVLLRDVSGKVLATAMM
jgi:hypothetical protein